MTCISVLIVASNDSRCKQGSEAAEAGHHEETCKRLEVLYFHVFDLLVSFDGQLFFQRFLAGMASWG